MVKKVNSCIFISGNGSNLESIIKRTKNPAFPIVVKLVISNNKNAKGLQIAKKHGIEHKFFNYNDRDFFENSTLDIIKKKKIKFLCLAGFMKVLSRNFIKKFKYNIINIHPSLLPKYKGLNTHKRVLKNNEKYTGCTVHYVTQKLDSGKIILQKKISINKNETEKSLQKRVLKIEHQTYPKAIKLIFK